jgi:hypothetical protein
MDPSGKDRDFLRAIHENYRSCRSEGAARKRRPSRNYEASRE